MAVAFTAAARELLPACATIFIFSIIAFLCIGRASRCKFSYAQSAPPWTSFRRAFVQIMALNAAAVTFLSLLGLFIAWIASGQSDSADESKEGTGSSADFSALGTLWSSFVQPIGFIGFLGQLVSFLHRMDSDLYPSPAHQLPPSFDTLPPTLSNAGHHITSEHIVARTAAQIHRDFVKRLSLRALVRITSAKLAAALALVAFVVGPPIVSRILEVIFSIQMPADVPEELLRPLGFTGLVLASSVAVPLALLSPLALAFIRGGRDEVARVWAFEELTKFSSLFPKEGSDAVEEAQKGGGEVEKKEGEGEKEQDLLLV